MLNIIIISDLSALQMWNKNTLEQQRDQKLLMFLSKHRRRLVKALAHEGNEDRNVGFVNTKLIVRCFVSSLTETTSGWDAETVHPDVPGGDAGFPVLKLWTGLHVWPGPAGGFIL